MSIRGKTAVVGIAETPTDRLGSKPGEPRKSTAEYLAWAARLAIEDVGLTKKDFDGQGLAAIYTTNHSQPFWPEEVAAILGITPGVSLAGGNRLSLAVRPQISDGGSRAVSGPALAKAATARTLGPGGLSVGHLGTGLAVGLCLPVILVVLFGPGTPGTRLQIHAQGVCALLPGHQLRI